MKRSYLVKIAMIVLFSLGSLGVVGGSFFLRKAFSSSGEPEVVTDTSRYTEIRNQLISKDYKIKHFPTQISNGDKDVRIAYSPGFAQGGSFFPSTYKTVT